MTNEERNNAIRCIKKWSEENPYLQTYKTCLEALKQCQVAAEFGRPSCDRNICVSNEYSGIGCDECICNTFEGCQREDVEETIPLPEMPCEEKVSISVLKQVMWERDIAISQLNELGYGFGQKMWISVNDFLPEESGEFLVSVIDDLAFRCRCGRNYKTVRVARFAHKKVWH